MRELLIGVEGGDSNPVPEWTRDSEIPNIGRIRALNRFDFDGSDVWLFALSFASSIGAKIVADWLTGKLRSKGQRSIVIRRRRVELETEAVRMLSKMSWLGPATMNSEACGSSQGSDAAESTKAMKSLPAEIILRPAARPNNSMQRTASRGWVFLSRVLRRERVASRAAARDCLSGLCAKALEAIPDCARTLVIPSGSWSILVPQQSRAFPLRLAMSVLALALLGGALEASEAEVSETGSICIAPFHQDEPALGRPPAVDLIMSQNTWPPAWNSVFEFFVEKREAVEVRNDEMVLISNLPTDRKVKVRVVLDGKPFETFWLKLGDQPEHRVCLWLYPGYWHWIDLGWTPSLGCKCAPGAASP
jgi:hypothetical protein